MSVSSKRVSLQGDTSGLGFLDKDGSLRLHVKGVKLDLNGVVTQGISADQRPEWRGRDISFRVLKHNRSVARAETLAGDNNWVDGCVVIRGDKVVKISGSARFVGARKPTLRFRLGGKDLHPKGEGVSLPVYAWYTLPQPLPAKGHFIVELHDEAHQALVAMADINLDKIDN